MSTRKPVILCPLRPGVECGDRVKSCDRCGWSAGEELRRKNIIRGLINMGQYNGTIKV